MISVNSVTQILSIFTLIGGIFIAGILIFLIYTIISKKEFKIDFIKKNGLFLAFIIALTATLGSLYYSEIAKYPPCRLCWFQRIFMYPQVILLGIAMLRKARSISYYIIPLSVIGAAISIYHYIIQRLDYASSCAADGVSCASKYIFNFGYITIPVMALTAFLLIIIFVYFSKAGSKNEK